MLLLGAAGLLGSHLARQLASRFIVAAPAREALDARESTDLDRVLDETQPDVVINTIAITPSSPFYGDAEAMVAVNALFPQRVAGRVRARGVRMIHVSTDGVFSGRRGGYRETDVPDPVDLYGRSKLAGEVEGAGCLNVRTSFFGTSPRRAGLIDWLAAQEGRTIDGHADYVFSGISAPVLSDVIGDLVERPLEGVLHVGGAPVSKHDVLAAAARAFRLPVDIRPVERGRVDRSLDCSIFAAWRQQPMPDLDGMMISIAQSAPPPVVGHRTV